MIIAATYRNPHNTKERYGQYYGRQTNPNGYDYKTGNVREVVKDLSTFTGMVFEDISGMISNGINNSINNNEEPVSPLEKIIHYWEIYHISRNTLLKEIIYSFLFFN